MILFGWEILIRHPRPRCGCGQSYCDRHQTPGPPTWNLYHPVTSRLDDVIADLDSAAAARVGTNWEWVRDKLARIEAQLSQFPRVWHP